MVETLKEAPRLLPPVELPAYTFIPGSTTPHPYRHPEGHSYKKKSPTSKPLADETWADNRSFLLALDLFNVGYYWEAHECWEATWHSVPRDTSFSLALQGLIQSSAYLLKAHMAHKEAAARLRVVSIEKLSVVLAREGSPYRGVDLYSFMEQLNAFERTGTWPRLG